MVSDLNNNKFYNMDQISDTEFSVSWGRVGNLQGTISYPIKKWNSMRNSKIRKGYQDITELKADNSTPRKSFKDITDTQVSDLILKLQGYASKSITENYTVGSEDVTQNQISRAQSLLDKISETSYYESRDFNDLNRDLCELYTIIPRRMSDVRLYILKENNVDQYRKIIIQEQSFLDTMKSQVKVSIAQEEDNSEDKTLLEVAGITVESVSDEEVLYIKNLLEDSKDRFKRAFKVTNIETQARYDKRVNGGKRISLWHGSRNENWWNILDTGLLIRPSSAILTGAMFGYGIYFADKAKKSIGYTSTRGSYWASGSSNSGYLALFSVYLGNLLEVTRCESWMSSANKNSLKQRGNYDSLFAKGGYDLYNNEYVVYEIDQCTISYIVEIS